MMFEKLMEHGAAAADRRARERARGIAQKLPPGVGVEETPEGLRLSGRGLKRRLVIEPALRWISLP